MTALLKQGSMTVVYRHAHFSALRSTVITAGKNPNFRNELAIKLTQFFLNLNTHVVSIVRTLNVIATNTWGGDLRIEIILGTESKELARHCKGSAVPDSLWTTAITITELKVKNCGNCSQMSLASSLLPSVDHFLLYISDRHTCFWISFLCYLST